MAEEHRDARAGHGHGTARPSNEERLAQEVERISRIKQLKSPYDWVGIFELEADFREVALKAKRRDLLQILHPDKNTHFLGKLQEEDVLTAWNAMQDAYSAAEAWFKANGQADPVSSWMASSQSTSRARPSSGASVDSGAPQASGAPPPAAENLGASSSSGFTPQISTGKLLRTHWVHNIYTDNRWHGVFFCDICHNRLTTEPGIGQDPINEARRNGWTHTGKSWFKGTNLCSNACRQQFYK